MKILDNFLSPTELKKQQKYAISSAKLITNRNTGLHLLANWPWGKNGVVNYYIFQQPKDYIPHPHIDDNSVTVCFYPFDSDGKLHVDDTDIDIIENRCVFLYKDLHYPKPSKKTEKYSFILEIKGLSITDN